MSEAPTRQQNGTTGLPAIPAAPAMLPDAARAGRLMEAVIAEGDLAKLDPGVRARYYVALCQSLGLNPMTQPFAYISVQGKLILYPNKGAAEQLGRAYGVQVEVLNKERIEDLWVVTVRASLPSGRSTEEIGAVPIKGKSGEDLANALMKGMTKAKRRAVLSLVGLGWLEPDRDPREGEPVYRDRHGNTALPSAEPPLELPPLGGQEVHDLFAPDEDRGRPWVDAAPEGAVVEEDPGAIAAALAAEANDRAGTLASSEAASGAPTEPPAATTAPPPPQDAAWEDLGPSPAAQPPLIDAPRPPTYAGERLPPASPAASPLATQSQVSVIYSIARNERGMSADDIRAWCLEHYKAEPSGLSKRDASAVIDALKASKA